MRREIKLIYLLYEMKRRWIIIVLIGLLGAALMTVRFYNGVRQQAAAARYASTCVIQVLENEEDEKVDSSGKIPDLKEDNIAMMKSDKVLNAVIGDIGETDDWSTQSLRSVIFCVGSCYGRVIDVFVLTEDQSLSKKICRSFSENAVDYLNENGKQAEILQEANEFGCATITQTKRQDNPEVTNTVLNQASLPTITKSALVKSAVKGFLLFAFIAYTLICTIYILKGRIVYQNELEDLGFTLIGKMEKEKIEECCNKALSMILLAGTDIENTVLIDLTKTKLSGAVTDCWKKRGVNTLVLGSVDEQNEVDKKDLKKDCNSIILLKSGEINVSELLNFKEILEKRNLNVLGVLFAE